MAENPFADLIPQNSKKRGLRPAKAAAGENLFADLVPAPVEHAPGVIGQRGDTSPEELAAAEGSAPNIGAKGDMRPGSRMASDLRANFAHGGLFNFSDELGAAVGVPVQMIKDRLAGGGLSAGETYDQNLAANRAEREAGMLAHPDLAPWVEAGGAVAGAVIPGTAALRGVKAGKALPGAVRWLTSSRKLVPIALRGAAVGGAAGALAGAGSGQGAADRLDKAAEGAETGAAIGLVAPGLARAAGSGYRLVRAAGRAVAAPVRALRRPEEFAAGKVAEAAKRDQMSTQRLARRLRTARNLKPDAVLADVGGQNTQKLLKAAADVPSDARAGLTRSLQNRQEAQRARLSDDVAEAFGDPAQFQASTEALALGRKTRADKLFTQAFATGTPWTRELEEVLSRPLTRKLVADAEEAAANRGEKFKSFFAQQVPGSNKFKISRVPSTEDLHRIKVQIDTAIRAIKKREPTSLGNINVRDLTILKQHLVGAIKNDDYKNALREFAGDSAIMNALDEGFEEGLTMEPEAIKRALSRLSPGEADMWRLGFARSVANKMRDSGVVGANRAEKLYSPAFMDRMRVVFRDPKSRDRFLKKLNLERRMFRTKNQVEGNSATHSRFVEGAEAGVEAENVREFADMGRKLVKGDITSALLSWVSRAKNTMTGLRPEVADEIIKLLTTKDPAKVARAQKMIDDQLKRLEGRARTPNRIESAVNAGVLSNAVSAQNGR